MSGLHARSPLRTLLGSSHDSIVGHSRFASVRTTVRTLTSRAQKCRCGQATTRARGGWLAHPAQFRSATYVRDHCDSERDRCPSHCDRTTEAGQVVRHKYRGQSETEQPSYYTVWPYSGGPYRLEPVTLACHHSRLVHRGQTGTTSRQILPSCVVSVHRSSSLFYPTAVVGAVAAKLDGPT